MGANLYPGDVLASAEYARVMQEVGASDTTVVVSSDEGDDEAGVGTAARPFASLGRALRDYALARITARVRVLVYPRGDGLPYDNATPGVIAPLFDGGSLTILGVGDPVAVAEVELLASGEFRCTPKLPSTASARDEWGLRTNQFHPVTVAMYSPNYWDAQDGIGHRHYFFMLAGCRNTEAPNGFYNEFLREDLMAHKRVFEALGGKMRVADAADQLSGVGFSATKRASFVAKVAGATERTLKVNI